MSDFGVATWTALGTTATVVVADARRLAAARAAVQTQLAAIDLACSRFRADSELMALNEAAGRWVDVSPLLLEAIGVALRAAELTDGAVDPTIGHALVLAGYDRDFASVPLSRASPAIAARRVPGWRAVELDRARSRARISRQVALDLGATAKALAADRAAAAAARSAGGGGVLVNLGGDIAVAGSPPPGGWPVRVADDHRAGPDAPCQSVRIDSGGLATSSTTVRRWGEAAHHIIDPATSLPAASRWRTVSVAAGSCVDANVASTAAIVLGDGAAAWLADRDLPARLVDQAGEILVVAGWPAEVVLA